MKRLLYILLIPLMFSFGCAEDIDITIPEDVDVANITGLTVYNEQLATLALKSTLINREAKTVVATFNAAQNLAKLKVSLTITPGSTVENPLGTGFSDFSQPKTITIVSPSAAVKSVWTITIVNP
jgi:hypothetical protein